MNCNECGLDLEQVQTGYMCRNGNRCPHDFEQPRECECTGDQEPAEDVGSDAGDRALADETNPPM